jgi:RimJ/RimL family protein N-acetyltransferase
MHLRWTMTIWDGVVMSADAAIDDRAGPGVIRTPRLDLVAMRCALVSTILKKDWPAARRLLGAPFPVEWRADGWRWLEPPLEDDAIDERFIAWDTRLALPIPDGLGSDRGPLLAEVGFHGPPDPDGWVEVGYRVVSQHRRRGLAEEAVRALLSWTAVRGAAGVKASVRPDNAIHRAAAQAGFAADGAHVHPLLGEQLAFRHELTPCDRAVGASSAPSTVTSLERATALRESSER